MRIPHSLRKDQWCRKLIFLCHSRIVIRQNLLILEIYPMPYHAYGSIFIYMFKQATHISYKFQGICKFVALTNKLIIKNMHLSITVSFKLNARERNKMHHTNMMPLMNISWQWNQSDNLHIWHDQPIYYINGWTVPDFYLFLFCKIMIEEIVLIFHCLFYFVTKQNKSFGLNIQDAE